jgi:hypothetical protein
VVEPVNGWVGGGRVVSEVLVRGQPHLRSCVNKKKRVRDWFRVYGLGL